MATPNDDITLNPARSTQATDNNQSLSDLLGSGPQSTQDFSVVAPTAPVQKPIPVDSFGEARADLGRTQQMLNEFNAPSTQSTRGAQAISQLPDEVIAPVAPVAPPSAREQLQAKISGDLDGTTKQSQADARAEKAESEQLAFLTEQRNNLKNSITRKRKQFELDMEEIEKNKTGSFGPSALNSTKNRLTKDFNRQNVFDTLDFHMANEDFRAAQGAVDTYIKDLQADEANELKSWEMLMNLEQNDMTESEKLQAQQAFSEKQAATSFQNSKDLAAFSSSLRVGEKALEEEKAPSFKPTEFAAATFAQRVQDSETALSGGRGAFLPFAPSFLKTGDRRQFEQSEKNFITAVLRRESGAAISPDEFKDAREVYIPKSTDSQEVLKQKARARAVILAGMQNEAGGASQLLQERLSITDTLPAPSSGTTTSGISYTVTQE